MPEADLMYKEKMSPKAKFKGRLFCEFQKPLSKTRPPWTWRSIPQTRNLRFRSKMTISSKPRSPATPPPSNHSLRNSSPKRSLCETRTAAPSSTSPPLLLIPRYHLSLIPCLFSAKTVRNWIYIHTHSN